MKKILTASEAVEIVKDGDTVMIGGFLRGGRPGIIDNSHD